MIDTLNKHKRYESWCNNARKAQKARRESVIPGSPRAARYQRIILEIDNLLGSREMTTKCLGLSRSVLRKRIHGINNGTPVKIRNEHMLAARCLRDSLLKAAEL